MGRRGGRNRTREQNDRDLYPGYQRSQERGYLRDEDQANDRQHYSTHPTSGRSGGNRMIDEAHEREFGQQRWLGGGYEPNRYGQEHGSRRDFEGSWANSGQRGVRSWQMEPQQRDYDEEYDRRDATDRYNRGTPGWAQSPSTSWGSSAEAYGEHVENGPRSGYGRDRQSYQQGGYPQSGYQQGGYQQGGYQPSGSQQGGYRHGGYQQTGEQWGTGGSHYSGERRANGNRGPKGYTRSDERIREDLCDRLMQLHDIDPTDVEIKVQNGEISLTGTVRNRMEKYRVEDMADSIAGAKEVNNQLRVKRQSESDSDSESSSSNSQSGSSTSGNEPGGYKGSRKSAASGYSA